MLTIELNSRILRVWGVVPQLRSHLGREGPLPSRSREPYQNRTYSYFIGPSSGSPADLCISRPETSLYCFSLFVELKTLHGKNCHSVCFVLLLSMIMTSQIFRPYSSESSRFATKVPVSDSHANAFLCSDRFSWEYKSADTCEGPPFDTIWPLIDCVSNTEHWL